MEKFSHRYWRLPRGMPGQTPGLPPILFREWVIYYAEDEGGNATAVNQMDMTKGTAAVFLSDSKYQLYPTWVSGNILIVLAEPAYDSTADEFWGVDTQSGSRLWKYAIPGAGRFGLQRGAFHVTGRL